MNKDRTPPFTDFDSDDYASFYVDSELFELADFELQEQYPPLPLEQLGTNAIQELEPILALFKDLDKNRTDILTSFNLGFSSEREKAVADSASGLVDNQGKEFIYADVRTGERLRLSDNLYYQVGPFRAEELALYRQLDKLHFNPQTAEDVALTIVNELRYCSTKALDFINALQQYLAKFYQELLEKSPDLKPELQNLIYNRLQLCRTKTNPPLFHFALQSRSSALCCSYGVERHVIGFNLQVLLDNGWNYIKDIITHECAHWLEAVYKLLLPQGIQDSDIDHETLWYRLSEIVFNHAPTKFNAYDTSKLYETRDFSKQQTYYVYIDLIEQVMIATKEPIFDKRYKLHNKRDLKQSEVINFANNYGAITISGNNVIVYPTNYKNLSTYRLMLKEEGAN